MQQVESETFPPLLAQGDVLKNIPTRVFRQKIACHDRPSSQWKTGRGRETLARNWYWQWEYYTQQH
jgi:hypothetical protein